MRDVVIDKILDAWGRLSLAGEPTSIRRIAAEAGVSVSQVWRRWSLLAPCGGETARRDEAQGLGRRHHDEIQRRIALVRAAKARLPMLAGLDATTLDQILPD